MSELVSCSLLTHLLAQARRALALAVTPKAAGRRELERAKEAELDWGVDLRHETETRSRQVVVEVVVVVVVVV